MKAYLILWVVIGYGIAALIFDKQSSDFKIFFFITLIAAIYISIEVITKDLKK